MYGKTLIMNLYKKVTKQDIAEVMPTLKQVGFDGFFTQWEPGRISEFKKSAKQEGLIYNSLHAPFGRADKFWHGNKEEGEQVIKELVDCLHECAENDIEIVMAHAYIGDFDEPARITGQGLERFGRVIDEAEKCGVKIAFENTEGLGYLDALMKNFHNSKAVGFCFDSGHELCYAHGEDMIKLYGDKLMCTHLNDNLGIYSKTGATTCLDDLHLLPFDGIIDWDNLARRIESTGFDGPLTFEFKNYNYDGRYENYIYGQMPLNVYLTECYKHACRAAARFK